MLRASIKHSNRIAGSCVEKKLVVVADAGSTSGSADRRGDVKGTYTPTATEVAGGEETEK